MQNEILQAFNEMQYVYVHGYDNVIHMANAMNLLQSVIKKMEGEDTCKKKDETQEQY